MSNQFDIYQMRVVILNDQPISSVQVNTTLSQRGFQNFSSLSDPAEIIETLNDSDNPVDLLLLDLNMLEDEEERFTILDTLTVQYNVQNDLQDKPIVIMFTNDSDKASRVKLLQSGATDYVIKPFDPIELIQRIEIQLEKRSLIKQLSVQQHLLGEKCLQSSEKMTNDYQEVLARLGQATEYRYHETGTRIKRVSFFVELIALELELGSEFAKLLRIATPLHDIGKIGISDKIMLKPDRLTFEEFEVMKTHVTIGAKILAGHSSDFLQLAHDIALTHHEKFDGTGYPNNLMGDKIPLCGRIVAIADVFDALTSDRVYKKSRSVEYAVELIKSERGRHFDPEVVDSFLTILPHIIEVKEKYVDIPKP
ncbi:Response regulator [hydrothermal vent metagenome]|uniref:Response regulator n=1 Tax=hydrothermal vent metagenome TaxID=652676 RepID=A0A3B0W650_9ZZZZ